jgi:hypothetical protein
MEYFMKTFVRVALLLLLVAAIMFGTAWYLLEYDTDFTHDALLYGAQYFEEKGQRELPFVEATYQKIAEEKGEDAARDFLTGYTGDFFGATIMRWDEMTREYWIQSRFGL